MKKLLVFALVIILCLGAGLTVSAERGARVVDNADLLDASEETALLAKLDALSEKHQMDIVVLTVETLEGKSSMAFADDYYDNNGYGYGNNYDGLLLLVAMEEREWYISTCGAAIDAFSDADIDSIGDNMLNDLSNGNYYSAFTTFVNDCDYYIDGYLNGFPFPLGMNLVISIGVGLIVAFIATSAMKGKLKSVRLQNQASNYVRNGSMKVTLSRDFFIYRTVSRTAKPKPSSSTHTSSSGRSHGGGGGSF